MLKKEVSIKKFYFFAMAPTGSGISGSDRIFIELAREWSKSIPITIYTTQEGFDMVKRQKLSGKYLKLEKVERGKLPNNFFLKYFYKIYLGIKLGYSLPITDHRSLITFIYSSSDFWMDVFPAVILKIRFGEKVRWIATWYQTAPKPLRGFSEQKVTNNKHTKERVLTYKFPAFLYWLSQLIAKPLITKYAGKVVVNNEDEKKQFPEHTKRGDTKVLLGAVPLDQIKKFLTDHRPQITGHQFDAVFQGRFHPQKGVVELIDIWKKVVEKKPGAKLAMIGDGPLMEKVKSQITNYKLQNNVNLFGYLFDGPKKYSIFASSKLVVHPAFYDSGGMASAEAMAFGIPAIGFNLKAYGSYYPKGMLKIKTGNLDQFAQGIINMLEDDNLRKRVGLEAKKMIENNWSWKKRAQEVLKLINS